jgi:hypothetical protein
MPLQVTSAVHVRPENLNYNDCEILPIHGVGQSLMKPGPALKKHATQIIFTTQ